jgi:guanylate kinase
MPSVGAKKKTGLLVVISGPSGAGKTTVCRALVRRYGYGRSVSATTRQPRAGEKDGVAYHFLTRKRFREGVKRGEFLEHSEHFDNLYGTPRAPVEKAVKEGRTVLLEIDVNGARQVMEKMKDAFSLFLYAPDFAEQERRLRGRHSDSEASIRTRLQRPEIEMAKTLRYDHWVLNDDLERTVKEIHQLIQQAEVEKKDGC